MPNLNFKPVRTFWRATRKIVLKHEQSLRNAILKEKEVKKHQKQDRAENSTRFTYIEINFWKSLFQFAFTKPTKNQNGPAAIQKLKSRPKLWILSNPRMVKVNVLLKKSCLKSATTMENLKMVRTYLIWILPPNLQRIYC